MPRIRSITLMLLAGGLLAACATEPLDIERRFQAAMTDPALVADWIIQGRNDFLLIDLRRQEDFERGHVPGAIRLGAEELAKPQVLRSLPGYKKLVFYNGGETPRAELFQPVFARGLHVMIMSGGYNGWQEQVLAEPATGSDGELAKRSAVSRYFRGEAASGTPKRLKDISAEDYVLPPALPLEQTPVAPQSEGC